MMKKQLYTNILVLVLIVIIVVLLINRQNRVEYREELNNSVKEEEIVKQKEIDKQKYYDKCYKLFRKLRFPDQRLVMKPPLKEPPADMKADFEQNGDMPITKYWYFNDASADASSKTSNNIPIITNREIDDIIEKGKKTHKYGYGDSLMEESFQAFHEYIKNKSMVVIGTVYPWNEALAIMFDAAHVTTLDYTRKKYERSNMDWIHVNDYLDSVLESKKFETFDYASSYSSIEHSGLGRFGDPLSPYGDVEAVQQIHCMLKPNGLFFLSMPVSSDGSSYIEFNAHRVYGTKRLDLLFKGWQLLDTKNLNTTDHPVFILKKI